MIQAVVRLPLAFCAVSCLAQTLVNGLNDGSQHLRQTDLMVLESGESRADIPCTVKPLKAVLDFDFAFHAGYKVYIPLTELTSSKYEDEITVLFRVTTPAHPEAPIYMNQKIQIPPHPANARGTAEFNGKFLLGEGKYHVDWLMRNRLDKVCAASWDLEAKRSIKETDLNPSIPAGKIEPEARDLFDGSTPAIRESGTGSLNVAIVLNIAASDPAAVSLDTNSLKSVISMVRQITRDPRVAQYSVTACSLPARKVLYSQQPSANIDLAAIGQALTSVNLGVVDAQQLRAENSPVHFLANVINSQANASVDAIVIVGERSAAPENASKEAVESLKNLSTRVFYLDYTPDPIAVPFHDLIGSLVKRIHGYEYAVAKPVELFRAWSDIVARISKDKRAAAE